MVENRPGRELVKIDKNTAAFCYYSGSVPTANIKMETRSFKFKPQKTTLRARHPLLIRLLFTAFYTAVILTACLYGLEKWIKVAPAKITQAAPQPRESAALPKPKRAVFYHPATAPGATSGSVALVKAGKYPVEDSQESSRSAARAAVAKPRLRPVTFGGSGGNFAVSFYEAPAAETAPPAVRARASDSEEEIFLKPSDLTKKIKVKGAKPVSRALAKRYSGMDPEAEMLRGRRRAKAAAAEAARKRLFREKLELSGIIMLLGLAVMLLGSRIIRALRLLKNPEGPHWTLK